jgi:hypothetical protein
VPICRLCRADHKRLVKSHIIPRRLFKLIAKDEPYSVYFKAQKSGVTTDYKQAGIYDEGILCGKCEARFSEWDKHGSEVISRPRKEEKDLFRDPQGIPCGFRLRDVDYDLLKRFLLAVLWRASVSTHEFFRGVNLGAHESRILNLLLSDNLIGAETYSAILIHPIGQRYPGTILPPWSSRLGSVRFCHLYFPDVFVLIKVDQRSTPDPFNRVQLQPDGENYMIFQPYRGLREEKFYTGMVNFMHEHKLFAKKPGKSRPSNR